MASVKKQKGKEFGTDNQPTVTISNIIDSLRLNPNNCVSRQGELYGKTHSESRV